MNREVELNIERALLKLLFEKGYISEDIYNYSLRKLQQEEESPGKEQGEMLYGG